MTATRRRLTAGALLALAAACLYPLAVRTVTGQIIENGAKEGRPVRRWWAPNHAAHTVTLVVSVSVVLAVVCIVLWCVRRGPPSRTLAAGVVLLAPVTLNELLKHLVLTRPRLLDVGDQIYLRHNTWPSGHVSAACAAAVVVLLVAPAGRRPLAALVGAAAVSAAALAMLWAEQHRPSDEIAAVLITGAIALFVVAARPGTLRPGRPGLGTAGRVLAAVAALAGAVVAVGLPPLLRVAREPGLAGHDYRWARIVGGAGVVCATALVMAVIGRLAPPDWVAGPRSSGRGRTRRRADGAGEPAPYVATRADEGSARCAEQLSSRVPAGASGERSPSGWPPTAGT